MHSCATLKGAVDLDLKFSLNITFTGNSKQAPEIKCKCTKIISSYGLLIGARKKKVQQFWFACSWVSQEDHLAAFEKLRAGHSDLLP